MNIDSHLKKLLNILLLEGIQDLKLLMYFYKELMPISFFLRLRTYQMLKIQIKIMQNINLHFQFILLYNQQLKFSKQ